MFIINAFIFLIFILCVLMVGTLALQILAALFYSDTPKSSRNVLRRETSTAVLIPAHNEASVIENTVKGILAQLTEQDRLIVVADNCEDNTAEIAEKAGAEVIERKAEVLRGKGYALDFGIKYLQEIPPDTVIIIDADCEVGVGGINQLAVMTLKHDCPIQALYLMENVQGATLKQKVAEFAFLVKNYVRPLGMKMFGFPCQLMGTGMAFPWHVIKSSDLANGNIVEDMKMGVDLILVGKPALFYPDVKVTSLFPTENIVVTNQRKRWEHGHLEMILTQTPLLLFKGIKQLNFKLIMFSLDLAVLPLALLSILLFCFTLSTMIMSMLEGAAFYGAAFFIMTLIFTASVLVAWHQFGRNILTAKDLLAIPFYIISKLPLYLGFVTNKQSDWVKTKREENNKMDPDKNTSLNNRDKGL